MADLESVLQADIVDALRSLGVWVIRTGVSSRRRFRRTPQSGEAGMPDLDLPGLGRLEVKLPGEELDPDQLAWHARARAHRVRVATVHSVREALNAVNDWRRQEERRYA